MPWKQSGSQVRAATQCEPAVGSVAAAEEQPAAQPYCVPDEDFRGAVRGCSAVSAALPLDKDPDT